MLSLNISTLFALIILTILFILSQGQEQDESFDENEKFYILGDFDNFYCNSTEYISSFTGIICTNQIISSNKNFSFSFKDTKSQSHKVKCDINYKSIIRKLDEDYSYYSDYESIDSDFPSPDEKNCFKTLCEFDGMIKEQFQFIINEDFDFVLDELFDDTYIGIYWYENTTYTVDKCYLVKNNFKQVLKYKANTSQKNISFLFISSIASSVKKNEKIYVLGSLIKYNNLTNINMSCISRYNAELVQNQEIFAFYDCGISNIDNPDEYEGLFFNYSVDVNNIPNNNDLKNPYKVDEMIKYNLINDLSIIQFNSNNLILDNCEQNGTFQIKGNIKGNIDSLYQFDISILLNDTENATVECSIPEGYYQEINITCQVKNNFYNSKIKILENLIKNEDDEIFLNITKISSNSESTCTLIQESETTYISTSVITTEQITEEVTINSIIPDEPGLIKTNVIFRQINNFDINTNDNIIKFNIIGFAFNDPGEKNSKLPVKVELVNNRNRESLDINCTLQNNFNIIVNQSNSNIFALQFICLINNINFVNNYQDIIILSSPLINNIPNIDSDLSSASKTKNLIQEGSLQDYSLPANFINIPPILSNLAINGDSCSSSGIFEINAIIDKTIDSELSFYLKLENPDIKVKCKLSQSLAYSRVNIICNTFDNFDEEYITINPKIVYDIFFNELLYINYVRDTGLISCTNNNEIKYEKALKKIESIILFRQVSKFRQINNRYTFFLATFIKQEIDNDEKIYITVEIKSSSLDQMVVSNLNKKIKYIRKLSRRETQEVECTVDSKTSVGDSGLGAAGWNCISGESTILNATGLDITESENISGIPDDPSLIDPAQTDTLIEEGEVTDYSIEENLNILLPLFNTLNLNYSMCRNNGSFSFEGTTTATIEKDILFNLTVSYPDTIFACKLPRVLKGEVIEIECYNRDEFENSTIMIEETVIREGNNEYFIFRNITSGDRFVTCSSSLTEAEANDYNEDFKTVSRYIKESNEGGLGVAGIVIIIIVGVLVLAGVTLLFIFIRSNYMTKPKGESSENRTFGTTSSSSYY